MATTDAPRRLGAHAVHLSDSAVDASTAYVLVDLSDTTNYPHRETNWLDLLGISICANTPDNGEFRIHIGTVTENDGTDGSADWIHCFAMKARDKLHGTLSFSGVSPDGIKCKVASDEYTDFLTNASQDDNANWQNDVGLASPAGASGGATGKPGVGDLVMWAEETGGSGTLDFSLVVFYEAH